MHRQQELNLESIQHEEKIIFGTYKEFPGLRYFESKFKQYYGDKYKIHSSLEDCLKELNDYISSSKPTTYFISDTHFGDSRALELSKRPYNSVENMDYDMTLKWNTTVKPIDTVYHLGDLGKKLDFICNLNGTKYFQKEIMNVMVSMHIILTISIKYLKNQQS